MRKTREVEDLQSRVAEADAGQPAPRSRRSLPTAQAELTTLQSDAESLQQRSTALLAEADATDSESKLDADSPSYLLHINGGIVKVTGVRPTGVVRRGARSAASRRPRPQPGAWQLERLGVPEVEPPDLRPRDRLCRRAAAGRLRRIALQLDLLHARRQPRAGDGGHSRRRRRLLPDAHRDARHCRSRSASPPRSISRSSRRRTAGPT